MIKVWWGVIFAWGKLSHSYLWLKIHFHFPCDQTIPKLSHWTDWPPCRNWRGPHIHRTSILQHLGLAWRINVPREEILQNWKVTLCSWKSSALLGWLLLSPRRRVERPKEWQMQGGKKVTCILAANIALTCPGLSSLWFHWKCDQSICPWRSEYSMCSFNGLVRVTVWMGVQMTALTILNTTGSLGGPDNITISNRWLAIFKKFTGPYKLQLNLRPSSFDF